MTRNQRRWVLMLLVGMLALAAFQIGILSSTDEFLRSAKSEIRNSRIVSILEREAPPLRPAVLRSTESPAAIPLAHRSDDDDDPAQGRKPARPAEPMGRLGSGVFEQISKRFLARFRRAENLAPYNVVCNETTSCF